MTAVATPPAAARRPEEGDGPLARAQSWLEDEPDAFARRRRPTLRGQLVEVFRDHPMAGDALVAFAVALLSGLPRFFRHPAEGAAFQALLVVPLVWRRRYPLLVFAFLCGVTAVQLVAFGNGIPADASGLVALYTVATLAPRRIAVLAATVAEVGVLLASAAHRGDAARSAVFLTALVAAAFFLGTNIRTRRQYLAALVDRAHRLEYERDQQAAMAVAAERASIAREMHDVVAHSLAVMITMADAASLKGRSEPDRAADAMRQVSETGRQALDETRRLVHVLRSERHGPLAPQPGLPQLDALLDQVRATGLRADLAMTGLPFPVPDGAQLAAYRIVQEALTNTLKHARHASRAHVVLRFVDGAIELEVTDDGEPQPAAPVAGSGHGIIGMRERAAMYGGTVQAGPSGDGYGGWCVRARLHVSAVRS